MTEREAFIGFSVFLGIGPLRFKLLIDYFGSAGKAWEADEKTLRLIGLGDKLTAKFVEFRRGFDPAKYEQQLNSQEIKIITRIDPAFPKLLSEITDPPIVLFVKGKMPEKFFGIGIVGTRKPTNYGRQITEKLSRELAVNGLLIVSGMARGIDGIAHRSALDLGFPTIAVLGCGVDIIYPPEHKDLYFDIIKSGGAVISEVPPGHTVLKGLFPARNRIISGLSLGIVVTEGAEDSGSLITARMAAEQGREVFAVPGPITSYLSVGPSKLIKQGAKIVTGVDDILEELNINIKYPIRPISNNSNKVAEKRLEANQDIVYQLLLTNGVLHYDEIIAQSNMRADKVGIMLTRLELSGIIQNLGNGKYGLK